MPGRPGLTQERVLDAAVELVDRDGPEGLTLAALAKGLGVRSPSLYNHVDGLEGVRRELRLRGLRELTLELQRAAVGRTRVDALRAAAHAYRSYALAHPGLYALTLKATEAGDEEVRRAGNDVVEVALATLRGYGLEGEEALHATRCVRSALHGFVTLEASEGFGSSLAVEGSFERLLELLDHGLAAGFPFPNLRSGG